MTARANTRLAQSPLAVALDTSDLSTATAWATAVAPHVSALKVGLQLFCAEGPGAVEKIRAGADVDLFLDLKLHDIPATVAGAAPGAPAPPPRPLPLPPRGGPAGGGAGAAPLPR